jgi:ABC-type uncharacterized transport system ATPase subunit
LSNWARNYQSEGFLIDDRKIINQAQHFANLCGYPKLAERFRTQEWLEKFKSKNLEGTKPPEEPLSLEN